MILHTVISEDDIFRADPAQKTVFRRVNGGLVELEETPRGAVVNRLYSTDPAMYLDKRYLPRTKFNLK